MSPDSSVFTVTFLPGGESVRCAEASGLSDLAAEREILIDHPCGAHATCGKCRVRFAEGAPGPTASDRDLLSAEALAGGWRLACRAVVSADAAVEVPVTSQVRGVKTFGPAELLAPGFAPRVRRLALTLTEPDLARQISLFDEIQRAVGGVSPLIASEDLLRSLPGSGWGSGGRVTVTLEGDEVLAVEPDHTERPPLGIAVDLGTTTVAAALVDLSSGRVIATSDALNPQSRLGADVIARIGHAQASPEGLADLQRGAVQVISDLVDHLAEQSGCEADDLLSMTVAGNAVMLHLLLGVSPATLGHAPYVGVWSHPVSVKSVRLGIPIAPTANVHLFPMVQSNVGGDAVAAVIAAGLDKAAELTLLIDLGTNSEVVLGNRERALATSTAAGPAFEGATISQGMRAAPGAVDRVSLRPSGDLHAHVIGGREARGICGTGLIDAAAALLATGVIDPSGRMVRGEEIERIGLSAIRRRVKLDEAGRPSVTLVPQGESADGRAVMITDQDIRQLQLVKGSILAGAQILLEQWGARWSDVGRVCIAGAFGSMVRKASALAIGLLPPVDPERIEPVGNAAGIGARLGLVDMRAWERAVGFAGRCEIVELGSRPEYQARFAEAMRFPQPEGVAPR